jgi:hypothetical protein
MAAKVKVDEKGYLLFNGETVGLPSVAPVDCQITKNRVRPDNEGNLSFDRYTKTAPEYWDWRCFPGDSDYESDWCVDDILLDYPVTLLEADFVPTATSITEEEKDDWVIDDVLFLGGSQDLQTVPDAYALDTLALSLLVCPVDEYRLPTAHLVAPLSFTDKGNEVSGSHYTFLGGNYRIPLRSTPFKTLPDGELGLVAKSYEDFPILDLTATTQSFTYSQTGWAMNESDRLERLHLGSINKLSLNGTTSISVTVDLEGVDWYPNSEQLRSAPAPTTWMMTQIYPEGSEWRSRSVSWEVESSKNEPSPEMVLEPGDSIFVMAATSENMQQRKCQFRAPNWIIEQRSAD